MAADDDKIRVLVVDDHAVVRRGLLAFLEGESDLDVVGDAEGGNEALDLLARPDAAGVRPDVVLMDLQMRPVDGIESTRMVRARYDDVEVVALTSFGEPERVQRALEPGLRGTCSRTPTRTRSRGRYVLHTVGSFSWMLRSLEDSCPRFKGKPVLRLRSLLGSSMLSHSSARGGQIKRLRGSSGSAREGGGALVRME